MKARYSPIAPVHLLEQLFFAEAESDFSHRYVGNYLLFLAHDVLAKEDDYHHLAYDINHGYGSESFYIMDNSVVELGVAMNLEDVITAADIVGAECIMTPDSLGSFPQTRIAIKQVLPQLLDSPYPLMRVPQGASPEELIACVDWLWETIPASAYPEYWGVPRWIANQHGTRRPIIQYINKVCPDAQIHLLGMSNNYLDDIVCTTLHNVMGIDSANPLVLGYHERLLGHMWLYSHLDRGNYWECAQLNEHMLHNARYMHDAVEA